MTMAQKRMAAMIMEEEGADEDEAVDRVGIVDLPGEAGAVQEGSAAPAAAEDDDEMQMEDSDDETAPAAKVASSSTATRGTAGAPPPTMKIRKDYQPKSLAERKAAQVQTTICPVCKESIPTAEMDEHVRIELLNPRYREQRADLESRRAQHAALTSGADPSRFLGTFARARTDIFGSEGQEELQAKREEEERRKAKEREKIIWDGHAASRVRTNQDFNRPELVESTMKDYQGRFKPKDTESIGPQGRPNMPGFSPETVPTGPGGKRGLDEREGFAQPPPAQRPAHESATGSPAPFMPPQDGSTMSAAPSGPRQAYPPQPHLAGPPYSHAPPGSQSPAPPAQMLSLTLHLPAPHSHVLTYDDLPLSATVSTIRDRVHAEIFAKGGLGASRIKLRLRTNAAAGKMLNLKMGLGEVVALANEERGGEENAAGAEEIDVIVK